MRTKKPETRRLRELAEKLLRTGTVPLTDAEGWDYEKLFHELQIQQVQLQAQHEDLRQFKADLQESQREYKLLFEEAPVGYVVLTGKGVISRINQLAARLVGFPKKHLMGKPLQTFLDQGSTDVFARHLRNAAAGPKGDHCELLLAQRSERKLVPVLFQTLPLPGGSGFRTAITDLTGRKREEETLLLNRQLREGEQRLRVALDAGQMGMWEWDVRTDRSVWSAMEYELLGLPPGEGTVSTDLFFRHVHPEDRGELERSLTQLMKDGHDWKHEFRIIREDGEVHWLAGIGRLYRDAEGNPLHMLGVNYDITEREQAAEALRKSESTLRSIFSASPIGFAFNTSNRVILWANEAMATICGYSPDELKGRSARMVYETDEEFSRVGKMIHGKARQGRAKGMVARWKRKDGEIRDVQVKAAWLDPEDPSAGFVFITEDITQRKRAEERLRDSEARFSTVFHSSPVGIGLSRLDDSVIIDVNEAFLHTFGYTREEVLGHTSLDLGLWPYPDERVRLLNTLRKQGRTQQYEVKFRRKSGEVGDLLMSAELLELGGQKYFLGILSDITARKQADNALQTSREQLRSLASHLVSVREEERSRMAREIHDELGQALTALSLDLAWLRKKMPPDQTALSERTEAMSRVLSDTVDIVTRIMTDLRPSVLDRLGLVPAIELQLAEFEKRTGIASSMRYRGALTLDEETSTALFRILQETLTNAARHAQATKVEVRLEEKKGSVYLIVQDNGRGITEEETSKPGRHGLLGIRERVQALSGDFTITRRKARGTAATVRIPMPGNVEP